MRVFATVALSTAAIVVTIAASVFHQLDAFAAKNPSGSSSVVDASGNLRVPSDYRESYQPLGSWAIASDQGPGSKQLHLVYASPGTIGAYLKTGHFPEGAVLVKEVYQTATKPMATGTVSSADTLKGWFVMVRDTKNHHPGNKLWGDGWGWSWFDADSPTKTSSTDYQSDCRSCHVPAQNTEWIYVWGYPPLRRK